MADLSLELSHIYPGRFCTVLKRLAKSITEACDAAAVLDLETTALKLDQVRSTCAAFLGLSPDNLDEATFAPIEVKMLVEPLAVLRHKSNALFLRGLTDMKPHNLEHGVFAADSSWRSIVIEELHEEVQALCMASNIRPLCATNPFTSVL